MEIIGWIIAFVIAMALFEEAGFFLMFIALMFNLSVSDDEETAQDPEVSQTNTVLVERTQDTIGSREPPQENASGGGSVSILYTGGSDAENGSDKIQEKVGVPSSGTIIETKLAIMKQCHENRKFVFVHNGIEYDISCGTAYKRKVQD